MIRTQLDEAVAAIHAALPRNAAPRIGLVLGSGLGGWADRLARRTTIPYASIPGFHASTVPGHAGQLVYGSSAGVPVLAMQGRIHAYEGHDLATVVFPARTLVAAGCTTLIITNAAGGVAPALSPGDLVLLSDHLNLMGASPLRGPNELTLGTRFPDMSAVYPLALREAAHRAAARVGVTLKEGVYAGLNGPQYETPAEIRMLRTLGADLVGMSTVPEAIAAVHMGAQVLGISCVTNLAAGVSPHKLSHDEVTETASRVRATFEALLDAILAELAGELTV
jgi:purine-nucleoside phosphorylase